MGTKDCNAVRHPSIPEKSDPNLILRGARGFEHAFTMIGRSSQVKIWPKQPDGSLTEAAKPRLDREEAGDEFEPQGHTKKR